MADLGQSEVQDKFDRHNELGYIPMTAAGWHVPDKPRAKAQSESSKAKSSAAKKDDA